MNLITFTFVIDPDLVKEFIEAVSSMREFWKGESFHISFFRDSSERSRYMLMFLTKKTVDELVALIQAQKQAKAVFDRIKDLESRVVVNAYEQLI